MRMSGGHQTKSPKKGIRRCPFHLFIQMGFFSLPSMLRKSPNFLFLQSNFYFAQDPGQSIPPSMLVNYASSSVRVGGRVKLFSRLTSSPLRLLSSPTTAIIDFRAAGECPIRSSRTLRWGGKKKRSVRWNGGKGNERRRRRKKKKPDSLVGWNRLSIRRIRRWWRQIVATGRRPSPISSLPTCPWW